VDPAHLPGWDAPAASPPSLRGWQQAVRSVLLYVPSLVARMEQNVLINPAHAEFSAITHGRHHPVWWDRRLFARGA
jgi:RES domain-containing protein